jgi:hypothetical protein
MSLSRLSSRLSGSLVLRFFGPFDNLVRCLLHLINLLFRFGRLLS